MGMEDASGTLYLGGFYIPYLHTHEDWDIIPHLQTYFRQSGACYCPHPFILNSGQCAWFYMDVGLAGLVGQAWLAWDDRRQRTTTNCVVFLPFLYVYGLSPAAALSFSSAAKLLLLHIT